MPQYEWESRFWKRVMKTADCWLWPVGKSKRYGSFYADGHAMAAHRVSASLHGLNIAGCVVRHTCDNPACVNPKHLVLGTQLDNIADRVTRGRTRAPKGEQHMKAELTEQQVLEIRQDCRTQKEIAKSYGVTQSNVSCVKLRKTWKHI